MAQEDDLRRQLDSLVNSGQGTQPGDWHALLKDLTVKRARLLHELGEAEPGSPEALRAAANLEEARAMWDAARDEMHSFTDIARHNQLAGIARSTAGATWAAALAAAFAALAALLQIFRN